MEGSPPDADVVVCSWRGDDRELTLATLRSVAKQAGEGRVHLVDMSPRRDLADRASEVEGVRVLWKPSSAGLGESRQLGLEQAEGRYVAFLDSDASPRSGWLAALHESAANDDVAVVGGPVLPRWPEVRIPRLFRTATAGDFLSMLDLGPQPLDVPRVLPGNMLVDRELTGPAVFASERGRNRGSLAGAEEIEMMVRVRASGKRIVYEPRALVDHRTTADRMTWRWMWRRARAAGREAEEHRLPLDHLPRRRTFGDWLFLCGLAPAYFAGRYLPDPATRSRR